MYTVICDPRHADNFRHVKILFVHGDLRPGRADNFQRGKNRVCTQEFGVAAGTWPLGAEDRQNVIRWQKRNGSAEKKNPGK